MHTQSYKAYLVNLEATGIGNTNVDVDFLLVISPQCYRVDNPRVQIFGESFIVTSYI